MESDGKNGRAVLDSDAAVRIGKRSHRISFLSETILPIRNICVFFEEDKGINRMHTDEIGWEEQAGGLRL